LAGALLLGAVQRCSASSETQQSFSQALFESACWHAIFYNLNQLAGMRSAVPLSALHASKPIQIPRTTPAVKVYHLLRLIASQFDLGFHPHGGP
jgi:hypothetical protein